MELLPSMLKNQAGLISPDFPMKYNLHFLSRGKIENLNLLGEAGSSPHIFISEGDGFAMCKLLSRVFT